jgi:hypothetical protein
MKENDNAPKWWSSASYHSPMPGVSKLFETPEHEVCPFTPDSKISGRKLEKDVKIMVWYNRQNAIIER